MTRTEKFFAWSLSIGLFISALLVLMITARINYVFGFEMAKDALQGYLHLAIHITAVIAMFMAGYHVRKQNNGYALVAGICGLLFASYGILNIMGYSASKRIALAKSYEMNLAAKQKAYDNTVQLQAQTVDKLISTIKDKKAWKSMRKASSDALSKIATNGPVAPPKVTQEEALPDPQATVLASMFNSTTEKTAIGVSSLGAVLAILAELFLSFGASFTCPNPSRKVKDAPFLEEQEEAKESKKPIWLILPAFKSQKRMIRSRFWRQV